MASTRLSVGLCIVMLAGVLAAVPAASAQQDQVTITATVVDQDDRSIGGIDVMATWDGGSRNVTTASNGQVLIDVPRGANVSLQIDDDRYVRNRPLVVDNAQTESVDIPVAESATAEITIQNTNSNAVEGARVYLYRGATIVTNQRTGADGTATTPPIEEGNYRLGISKAGYYTNRTSVSISGQDTVNWTLQSGEKLLTVSVADDYFDPPESLDASVNISDVGVLSTGDDGNVGAQVPVNTDYDITVTKDGYDRGTQTVSVGQTDTTTTVYLSRTDELDIDSPNQELLENPISLAVTDEYDDPATGATVTLNGEQVGTTDENGEFETTAESAGLANFTVDDGDTQATVSVNVIDPDATPEPTPEPTAEQTPEPTATTAPTDENTSAATEPATTGGDGPGFTPVTALAALALLSLVAYRRR